MSNFRRSRLLNATTIGALSLLILSGCKPAPADKSEAATLIKGGTLVYATGDAEPTCLDPNIANSIPGGLVGTQYIESLFYVDDDLKIQPWLASGATESADGLSWIITINKGIKFSDGSILEAKDVKASLEFVRKNVGGGQDAIRQVQSIDIVDANTVRLNLSERYSPLLENITQIPVAIESAESLQRTREAICEKPIGTGPFAVQSWTKQDNITLVRNEFYNSPYPGDPNQGVAYVDKVTWKFIPDAATRFAALQSGDADIIDVVTADQKKQLAADKAFGTLSKSRPGALVYLALNTRTPPFDDIRVRQAFIESVDIPSALKSVYFSTIEQRPSILSSATQYAVDNFNYKYDPDHAKQLLDAAGWKDTDGDGIRDKDGKPLTIVLPYAKALPVLQGFWDQLQATGKAVGIDVKLQPLADAATRAAVISKWQYNATGTYYTVPTADVLRRIFHSNFITTDGTWHPNFVHLKDPKLDTLLEQATQTSDTAKRAELYSQAQDIVRDGYYTLPLYDQKTELAYNARVVHGLNVQPGLAMPWLQTVWLKR